MPRDQDANEAVNKCGIIPDIMIRLPTASDARLGGYSWLADVKTLAPGTLHKSSSKTFASAVEKRQARVKVEYSTHAASLDRKYHNTRSGPGVTAGPFASTLLDFGKDGEVLGLVVGAFGEASQDVHSLRDCIALELAKEYSLFLRTDVNKAHALFTSQLNRKWGHTIARGWARLVVERFQEQTHDKSPTSRLHRNAEIENIG